MHETLPDFPYHPDPVATGVVKASDVACVSCGRPRGLIYTGPVFGGEELDERLCPWCIADGSAAARFHATFTEDGPIPAGVSDEVVTVVTTRTPGFDARQQEHWLYHCHDGAAFLGAAGWPELKDAPEVREALRDESAQTGLSPMQIQEYLRALDKDGSPTAYLFRCRHCGTHLAYADGD